ncbi:hypothetical protein VNO77_13998 [Canavalia gladiata]|uniref:Uncharacterized protein n=1 Tax=Canavalia gladiata TaxID=3824 RepID=A0AAN9M363_CANGL
MDSIRGGSPYCAGVFLVMAQGNKARPVLNDSRKLSTIMDPKLEVQYSEMGARKAAALDYQCLSHRPRNRPLMTIVVKILEPLKDFDDIPIGPFVYTVPVESNEMNKENEIPKEQKSENDHHHHNNGHRHHDNNDVHRDANKGEVYRKRKRENDHHHRNHHRHNGHRHHPFKSPKPISHSKNDDH